MGINIDTKLIIAASINNEEEVNIKCLKVLFINPSNTTKKTIITWYATIPKTFTINPWDTVWTVTHRQTLTDNKDAKTKLFNGLKALKEKFSIACKQFDIDMENKKATRHEYVSFLMRNHAPNLINLKGTEAYEEGCALREAKYAASLKEIKALGRVLALNNSIQSQLSQIKYMV